MFKKKGTSHTPHATATHKFGCNPLSFNDTRLGQPWPMVRVRSFQKQQERIGITKRQRIAIVSYPLTIQRCLYCSVTMAGSFGVRTLMCNVSNMWSQSRETRLRGAGVDSATCLDGMYIFHRICCSCTVFCSFYIIASITISISRSSSNISYFTYE